MEIEFEATFINIDKDRVRGKLKGLGAQLIKSEFLQKRIVFNLPKGHEIQGGWLRVRDEGDKITMSLKVVDGDSISDQKEVQLNIDNFDNAVLLLESIGCNRKAFQESKREIWSIDNVEIMIDEWPFLEPYVEVEGKSEEAVKQICGKLGFDYSQALFDSVDGQYSLKYGVSKELINQRTPEILFNMENPFLNRND